MEIPSQLGIQVLSSGLHTELCQHFSIFLARTFLTKQFLTYAARHGRDKLTQRVFGKKDGLAIYRPKYIADGQPASRD